MSYTSWLVRMKSKFGRTHITAEEAYDAGVVQSEKDLTTMYEAGITKGQRDMLEKVREGIRTFVNLYGRKAITFGQVAVIIDDVERSELGQLASEIEGSDDE